VFGSVRAGPHRPGQSGKGERQSRIYVVYENTSVYPDFLVSYRSSKSSSGGGGGGGGGGGDGGTGNAKISASPTGALTVSDAGLPEFNGVYCPDGKADGVARFRIVDKGTTTMNRSKGVWYLCKEHTGCFYKQEGANKSDTPPASGWVVGTKGSGDAPSIRVGGVCGAVCPSSHSIGLYESKTRWTCDGKGPRCTGGGGAEGSSAMRFRCGSGCDVDLCLSCFRRAGGIHGGGSAVHAGEWRNKDALKQYCKLMPSDGGAVQCVHGGGIAKSSHWSCCGAMRQGAASCSAARSSTPHGGEWRAASLGQWCKLSPTDEGRVLCDHGDSLVKSAHCK